MNHSLILVLGLLGLYRAPTCILTVPETLTGFSGRNVILIAALFVVGEGLVHTGMTILALLMIILLISLHP